MVSDLKNVLRQILPVGLSEYSIRRHAYLRMGFQNRWASLHAFSSLQYRSICDARLDLIPTDITKRLRTCVDAGAHVGHWTQALLSVFDPERILAIECDPRLVNRLRDRIGNIHGVTVVDAALSGADGVSPFNQLRHPAGSSLLKPRSNIKTQFEHDSWDVIGQVPVKTITYDRLVECEESISILKLDIQGVESQVIANSVDGIQKTKSIVIEVTFTPHYEGDSGFSELHNLMRSKGFGLYRLSPIYHRGGRALFADAVYVREEILEGIVPNST